MNSHPEALPAEALAACCDPASLGVRSTRDLEPLAVFPGQSRATGAIRLALEVRGPGYNLFVIGQPGYGRHTAVMRLLEQAADPAADAGDWLYLPDFDDPDRPWAVRLAGGTGHAFRGEIAELLETLERELSAVLAGADFQQQVDVALRRFDRQQREALSRFSHECEAEGLRLLREGDDYSIVAVRDGRILDTDAFASLPAEEREAIETRIDDWLHRLRAFMRTEVQQWRQQRDRAIAEARSHAARALVDQLIAPLRARYEGRLADWLGRLGEALVAAVDAQPLFADDGSLAGYRPEAQAFLPNVLVARPQPGTPVVYEESPAPGTLLGRIDYGSEHGTLVTDFSRIRAGALHRANGGCLILDARRLVTEPTAWEGLKRALTAGQIRFEPPSTGQTATQTLEPEPIPLDVKVILIGDRELHRLLLEADPDLRGLFRVVADFEETLPRQPDAPGQYARLIAGMVRHRGVRHVAASGIAALIDEMARLGADDRGLSLHMLSLEELLVEADRRAAAREADLIEVEDVTAARAAREARGARLAEHHYRDIQDGILRLATEGAEVGQVNALPVIEFDGIDYGVPSRVSATVRVGEGDVLDIEREVELGGTTHSKGVFILASYLGGRFGVDQPLSLEAAITFEQSYGPIEGDSASLAELCALLSALSGLALDQGLGVTGSVDQHGRVQAVGAVNEKIEGFFEVCRRRGLSGCQGVIIPASNRQTLMLRASVREAVAAGRFRVLSVTHVDAAMQALTGIEAGAADADGRFPPDSVNGRVQARLEAFARARHSHGDEGREGDSGPRAGG
ncbi:Lon protease family protein [Thiohalobacter sp.]|uniref:Lon protease family protein n=1 Tax=Thiohalobacter sp. TaxID=2025948 RepID=UPI002603AD03|nr:ATP-binding protein [Thiohalobacter sp.]